jgi:hypothetical protein
MTTRSRVVIGFHRLGLLLAAPFFLGALGTAVYAFIGNNGPIIPDPGTEPPLRIRLATEVSHGATEMTNDELVTAAARALVNQGASSIATTEVDTGPIRTFAFYRVFPNRGRDRGLESTLDDDAKKAVLMSITSFERQRGEVLSLNEQPVRVGDVMVREIAERQRGYTAWTHLKHGVSFEIAAGAGGLAVLALLFYALARALGWVMDGFISKPEGQ